MKTKTLLATIHAKNGGFGGGYSWQGMQTFRSEMYLFK